LFQKYRKRRRLISDTAIEIANQKRQLKNEGASKKDIVLTSLYLKFAVHFVKEKYIRDACGEI